MAIKQQVRFNPPMDSRNAESYAHRILAHWTHITFIFPYGTLGWEHCAVTPHATLKRLDNGRLANEEGMAPDAWWDIEVTYPREEARLALETMAKLAGRDDIAATLSEEVVVVETTTVTVTERRSLRDWRQYLK